MISLLYKIKLICLNTTIVVKKILNITDENITFPANELPPKIHNIVTDIFSVFLSQPITPQS